VKLIAPAPQQSYRFLMGNMEVPVPNSTVNLLVDRADLVELTRLAVMLEGRQFPEARRLRELLMLIRTNNRVHVSADDVLRSKVA
jgi:hypothetical protein